MNKLIYIKFIINYISFYIINRYNEIFSIKEIKYSKENNIYNSKRFSSIYINFILYEILNYINKKIKMKCLKGVMNKINKYGTYYIKMKRKNQIIKMICTNINMYEILKEMDKIGNNKISDINDKNINYIKIIQKDKTIDITQTINDYCIIDEKIRIRDIFEYENYIQNKEDLIEISYMDININEIIEMDNLNDYLKKRRNKII